MKTIPEIKKLLEIARSEEKELESELSRRMYSVIHEEIKNIKLEFGAYPSNIDVEFMNTSVIGEESDHYIMQNVYVKI